MANEKSFKLYVSEGTKKLKKGFNKTFLCNQEGCKFKSDDGTQYKIYLKFSKKYTQHRKCYNFYEFILLDHKLSYEKKSIFDELILEEINLGELEKSSRKIGFLSVCRHLK